MCTPIHQDAENTAAVPNAAAITGAVGAMVRKHALIRNECLEADGSVTFDAGRGMLAFMARLNHNGTYDLQTFRGGELKDCMEDLSKDGLGLAILTLVDRS